MTPEQIGKQLWDAPLDKAEFDRRLDTALSEEDTIAELAELAAWFKRRYPSGRERLAYARRKYAEMTRLRGRDGARQDVEERARG